MAVNLTETTIVEHNMVELLVSMWAYRLSSMIWVVLAVCLFGFGMPWPLVVGAGVTAVLDFISSIRSWCLLENLTKRVNKEG